MLGTHTNPSSIWLQSNNQFPEITHPASACLWQYFHLIILELHYFSWLMKIYEGYQNGSLIVKICTEMYIEIYTPYYAQLIDQFIIRQCTKTVPVKCTVTLLWETVVVLKNMIIIYCLDEKRVYSHLMTSQTTQILLKKKKIVLDFPPKNMILVVVNRVCELS